MVLKSINEHLSNATISLGTDIEKMDKESKIQFYNNRLSFLNNETQKLEDRKIELLQQMEKEVTEFKKKIIAIGCDIASLEQLWTVLTKDTGVAEMNLKDLMEETSQKDAV